MARRRRGKAGRSSALWLATLPRPTRRGWGFVVTAVVFFVAMEVLQRREFSFFALLVLALPVLAMAGLALNRLPFTVERRFSPEPAPAGSVVGVQLIVRNWGAFATPEAVWFDDSEAPLRPSALARLPRLPGFRASATGSPAAVTLNYRRDASHRGQHVIGPLVVLLGDPFGMAVRRASVGGTDTLTVTPSIVPLPRGAVRLAVGTGSARQSRQLGGGGEHDVISRKYQTGDSMRRVNWSATARFGELMVRQDDQQNDQHAIVLLDSSRRSFRSVAERGGGAHSGGSDEIRGHDARDAPADDARARSAHRGSSWSPEFEWAVSMATSIGVHLLGEGFHLRVIDSAHAGAARFEPTGGAGAAGMAGEDALLLHAARAGLVDGADVDLRLALGGEEPSAVDMPPVFAVVGHLSELSARSLAGAARFASGAVAIIVVPGPGAGAVNPPWAAALRDLLEDAGWIAHVVSSDDAPSSVWGSAGGERPAL
ncbi:hypothetical protein BH09ACT6_BH09ACT6_14540 [soil metagenome]